MPTDPFVPWNQRPRTYNPGAAPPAGAAPSAAPAAPPPDDRQPLTGSFNETNQTPQYGPGRPNAPSTQLASYNGTYGPGSAFSNYLNPTDPQTTSYGTHQNPLVPAQATPPAGLYSDFGESSATLGGNPNSIIGQPSRDAANNLFLQAYGSSQRGAPQINMGPTNMFAQGVGNELGSATASNLYGAQALQTADRSNLYADRNALDLAALANGRASQGQFGAADRLMGMSQMPTGPSVAEQQLRQGADQAMRQQMAMAASARGGNAALALQNAGQNQGNIMGTLNSQLGIQRAQEDMANRQFAANAAQGAGAMYGNAAGTQMNALGTSANIFGNVANNQVAQGNAFTGIANNQVNAANTNLGLTNTYAGLASQQAALQGQQNALNDQTMLGSQAMGYNLLNQQRAAEMGMMQQQWNAQNQRYAIDKNAQNALQLQASQNQNNLWHEILGGTIAAGGAIAAPFTGGASVAAVPAGVSIASSDIRAKKDIQPAGEDISDAFRSANRSADQLMGMPVSYPALRAPGYEYAYNNPNAPGAAAGTHYGPMAQDLEQTPVGASVVSEGPGGKKQIDTSRLTLVNTSELSKQRAELDALKAQVPQVTSRAPMAPWVQQRPIEAQGRAPMMGYAPSRFAIFGAPQQVDEFGIVRS